MRGCGCLVLFVLVIVVVFGFSGYVTFTDRGCEQVRTVARDAGWGTQGWCNGR